MQTAQEILSRLVSFPVLGGQSNFSIINWIRDYLDQYGVAYHLVPHESEAKISLHCRIGPAVDGGVILSGHTDVVPVAGQDWTTDPFKLIEKDGKLYARGACDMKGFLACCLAGVPDMLAADLKKPIYFAFSYDEEIGCLAGPDLVAAILKNYTEKPRYAIIGEPSSMQPIVGQKGICIFKVTIHGSAGHSSRINQEVSAIHEAARAVLWLENKMQNLIENGHTDDRFDPNHSSIHIGTIQGGIAPNVIADKCVFHWDVRVIPGDHVEEIVAAFETYCREREALLRSKYPGFKIENEAHHPPVPSLDTPENLSIVQLIKTLSGQDKLQTVAYASEAGQFAAGGFETVICGPGSIAQAHRANEFISLDQLGKGVGFIQKLIEAFSRM